MSQGWFKIWRQVQLNWVWNDRPFARGQAWIDLISRAIYKDGGESVFFMNRIFALQRGELVTSLRILAKEWSWSTKKVSKFLDDLQSDKMIEKRNSDFLRIYILNYEKYQPIDEEGKQQGNSKETARKQQGNTINKVKECKESNNNILATKWQPNGNQMAPQVRLGKLIMSPVGDNSQNFNNEKYIDILLGDSQRHIHVIGLYWKNKQFSFPNKQAAQRALKRELKAAKDLVPYIDEDILGVMTYLEKDSQKQNYEWTLETVYKRIDHYRASLSKLG